MMRTDGKVAWYVNVKRSPDHPRIVTHKVMAYRLQDAVAMACLDAARLEGLHQWQVYVVEAGLWTGSPSETWWKG